MITTGGSEGPSRGPVINERALLGAAFLLVVVAPSMACNQLLGIRKPIAADGGQMSIRQVDAQAHPIAEGGAPTTGVGDGGDSMSATADSAMPAGMDGGVAPGAPADASIGDLASVDDLATREASSGDASPDMLAPGCVAGSMRCEGSQPQVCSADGQWQSNGPACGACSVCSTATGACTAMPAGSACDDGNACTKTDVCTGGSCVGSNPVVCAAPDQCHSAGVCNPTTGTCSNPAKPDNSACNDSSGCTQTDTCKAGVCTPGPAMTCNTPDQCHTGPGTCNAASSTCSYTVKPDGTACNADNSACTQNDTCKAGVCTAGTTVACSTPDQCHSAPGTCDPTTGACSYPIKADGASCNSDNDACTQNDSCRGGACTPGTRVTCTSPPNPCRVSPGTCSPATGACAYGNKADNTPCNFDNDACTQSDSCKSGVCAAGSRVVCPAAGSCKVAGTCSPATGLCSAPTNKGLGVTDAACPASVPNCQAGGCDGVGGCRPAAAGTECAGYTCANGPSLQGQYASVDRRRKLCDGTLGAAACKSGSNDGCLGNLSCATAAACRATCVGDGDCLSGNFCSGGGCSARKAFGSACSTNHECATRLCGPGNTCIECLQNNFCPQRAHTCTAGRCGPFDGATNSDGTPVCAQLAVDTFGLVPCGSGAPSCVNSHCVCGTSADCANGTICLNGACKIDGRQACVANSECASGSCVLGMCAPTADGTLCRGPDLFTSTDPGGCAHICFSVDLSGTEICGLTP